MSTEFGSGFMNEALCVAVCYSVLQCDQMRRGERDLNVFFVCIQYGVRVCM